MIDYRVGFWVFVLLVFSKDIVRWLHGLHRTPISQSAKVFKDERKVRK